MIFEPIIGLEVHVELKTKSKMFCGCDARYFGSEPNTHTCPVCLGLPGALPVPNRKAVEWCIRLGLALNCKINGDSYFERKNYFYPDLPKGYQISQYAKPFCVNGHLDIKSEYRISNIETKDDSGRGQNDGVGAGTKRIRINRVHMEEDTGKLTHGEVDGEKVSLVDFNRSGVPLVEIVTEPDFRSTEEVTNYLKKLQLIIRYLGISDADMEEGSMRIEPTINLRVKDQNSNIKNQNDLGEERIFYTPLVEIKNINSFRFVKQALEYEIKRQAQNFEETSEEKKAGNKTTAGYSEAKRVTVPQRSKEEANDYRYFPEPDIPPISFTQAQIDDFKSRVSELPDAKIERYSKDWAVKETDSRIIVSDMQLSAFFEEAAKAAVEARLPVAKLASLIVNKKVDTAGKTPQELVKTTLLESQKTLLNEQQIKEICAKIVGENSKAAEEYRAGKPQSLKYLLGLVMKETKGGADPVQASSMLESLLKN